MKLEDLSCRRRLALLLGHLDRELHASQRRLLDRHRSSCRSCAALLTTLERTVKTLKILKRASSPSSPSRRALRAALAASLLPGSR